MERLVVAMLTILVLYYLTDGLRLALPWHWVMVPALNPFFER